MLREMQRQLHHARPLSFQVEQNFRWSWKRFTQCIGDRTERKQRNTVLGASPGNELGFHIHGQRARGLRDFVSLFTRFDHRRHGQKIGHMHRKICKRRAHPTQVNNREIFSKQEISSLQLIVERAGKTCADQIVKLLILKKAADSLSAGLFADTGMKDLDRAMIDLPADRRDAIAMAPAFVVEAA